MKNQLMSFSHRSFLALAVALALVFVLMGALHVSANDGAGDETEVELRGVVLRHPEDPAGHGLWLVRGAVQEGAAAQVYTVTVDAGTKFGHGLPRIGDQVKIRGDATGAQTIYAQEVEREDDGGNSGEYENKGQVVARPASAYGIGTWQLSIDSGAPLTVTATAQTRFPTGIPAVGEWVEVRGALQSDGSLLAERIRLDDFEADQLIVRLRPGVRGQ